MSRGNDNGKSANVSADPYHSFGKAVAFFAADALRILNANNYGTKRQITITISDPNNQQPPKSFEAEVLVCPKTCKKPDRNGNKRTKPDACLSNFDIQWGPENYREFCKISLGEVRKGVNDKAYSQNQKRPYFNKKKAPTNSRSTASAGGDG